MPLGPMPATLHMSHAGMPGDPMMYHHHHQVMPPLPHGQPLELAPMHGLALASEMRAPHDLSPRNGQLMHSGPPNGVLTPTRMPYAPPQQSKVPVALPKKSKKPEFLVKLYRMLHTEDPAIICWDNGRIHVNDPKILGQQILHKYFRHSKYSSFQRQLNYFGFRKTNGKGKMSACTYTNFDLTNSNLKALLKIKRKTNTTSRPAVDDYDTKVSSDSQSVSSREGSPEPHSQGDGNDRLLFLYQLAAAEEKPRVVVPTHMAPQHQQQPSHHMHQHHPLMHMHGAHMPPTQAPLPPHLHSHPPSPVPMSSSSSTSSMVASSTANATGYHVPPPSDRQQGPYQSTYNPTVPPHYSYPSAPAPNAPASVAQQQQQPLMSAPSPTVNGVSGPSQQPPMPKAAPVNGNAPSHAVGTNGMVMKSEGVNCHSQSGTLTAQSSSQEQGSGVHVWCV